MDFSPLWRSGPPGIHVASLDAAAWAELHQTAHSRFKVPVIRVIRGSKSRNVSALFDEMSAALQFPDYFGENWDAFVDCLGDLDWIPGDFYLLIVTRAEQLLTDAEDSDLRTLTETLATANRRWATRSTGLPSGRPGTLFQTIFDDTPAGIVALTERLSSLAVEFDALDG